MGASASAIPPRSPSRTNLRVAAGARAIIRSTRPSSASRHWSGSGADPAVPKEPTRRCIAGRLDHRDSTPGPSGGRRCLTGLVFVGTSAISASCLATSRRSRWRTDHLPLTSLSSMVASTSAIRTAVPFGVAPNISLTRIVTSGVLGRAVKRTTAIGPFGIGCVPPTRIQKYALRGLSWPLTAAHVITFWTLSAALPAVIRSPETVRSPEIEMRH